MTSGQWPVNQCYCLTSLYKPLLLHISFSARGWQWRCLIRGSRLTWPRRQSTSREWRGECPVFRNGWLLFMRQVNVETLGFGFQAAMNKYKRLSYWKFVMKVLNCVLVNIDSVLIKWLVVWWSLITTCHTLGKLGDETLQTFTFSIQLPLAGKIWQCVTSLNVDQGPDHFQERLLTWLYCTPWDLIWHDNWISNHHWSLHLIIILYMLCDKWAGFWFNLNLIYPQSLCIDWAKGYTRQAASMSHSILCTCALGDGQLVFLHSGFFLTLCATFSGSTAVVGGTF